MTDKDCLIKFYYTLLLQFNTGSTVEPKLCLGEHIFMQPFKGDLTIASCCLLHTQNLEKGFDFRARSLNFCRWHCPFALPLVFNLRESCITLCNCQRNLREISIRLIYLVEQKMKGLLLESRVKNRTPAIQEIMWYYCLKSDRHVLQAIASDLHILRYVSVDAPKCNARSREKSTARSTGCYVS